MLDSSSPSPGAVFSQLVSQFLSRYVPGVVRTRLEYDLESGDPLAFCTALYVDVAAGGDPERVVRDVTAMLEARYMITLRPEQVHLRHTDEPQPRLAVDAEGRSLLTLTGPEGNPEPDEPVASGRAPRGGGDREDTSRSAFDFQRRRGRNWYAYRDAYSQDTAPAASMNGDDESASDAQGDAELERAAHGEIGSILVAHPVVLDVLVEVLLLNLEAAVIEPSREARRDLRLLQEILFSEWLVMAAERLALPSEPFDDSPDDPYKVGDIIIQALDLPLPVVVVPAALRYAVSSREEKRQAMRDAAWFMVSLSEQVVHPAYTGLYDPIAVEAMLLVGWLRLAAEFAGAKDEVIRETFPGQGAKLDELLTAAAGALERLCIEQGLVTADGRGDG